jgi:GDP-L-fucose synthase
MNVFVTGATGFLGKALTAQLERRGHRVVGVGSRACDLTRSDSLARFSSCRFDQIYHLAAWTQAGDFCLHHAGEQWLRNQQMNANVLAWWQAQQPQAKLIAMGTSCAYAPDLELSEDNYLRGEPIDSLYTYAMTKRMLAIGLRSLHQQFGLRYLCLVPSTLYGPGYHSDGRQMHFIFDLIRKIVTARRDGTAVVLWGDGHQRRELVYIDDFVEATMRLADVAENMLVNIGAGEEHSIRDFARRICEQVGYDFNSIQFDAARYVGARSKCLCVHRLRQLLPDFQQTPLTEGLARTIAWFRASLGGHSGDEMRLAAGNATAN